MSHITFDDVSKTFRGPRGDDVCAVDNLSLRIEPGELLVLLGPSGCGKTTTLRLLAGLDSPTAGRIFLDSERFDHLPPERRNVSMLFQDPALLPQLNVLENIALPLRLRGIEPEDRGFSELVEALRLNDLLRRRPETLSGGQQQRVALARALISRPTLLLLDEPLSNLDALSREELRESIRAIHRDRSVMTLYVTHDQQEAMHLNSRIAIMNRGRIEQDGSTAEVFRRPKTRFVAEFFGNGFNQVPHPSTGRMLGFRPSDGVLSADGQWEATVKDVTDLGAWREVRLCISTSTIRVMDFGSSTLRSSQKVRLHVPEDRWISFLGD